jgi:hypothetical protein
MSDLPFGKRKITDIFIQRKKQPNTLDAAPTGDGRKGGDGVYMEIQSGLHIL